jgi:hypothetical protein
MLAACDDFFSTSWGTARKYDLSKIDLTQDNLREWKEKAIGNPELAAALVEKIISELPGKSGVEKAVFQDAGIDLAIEQSGIGALILNLAGKDLAKIKDEAGVKDMLGLVQSEFSNGDGDAAARNIAAIVQNSISNGGAKFLDSDQYAAQANPSDIGMAIAVLALTLAPDIKDSNDDMKALLNERPGININNKQVIVEKNASQEEVAMAMYLNLIAGDKTGKYTNSPMISGLKSAFKL